MIVITNLVNYTKLLHTQFAREIFVNEDDITFTIKLNNNES